jgi:hypothetical protein
LPGVHGASALEVLKPAGTVSANADAHAASPTAGRSKAGMDG